MRLTLSANRVHCILIFAHPNYSNTTHRTPYTVASLTVRENVEAPETLRGFVHYQA